MAKKPEGLDKQGFYKNPLTDEEAIDIRFGQWLKTQRLSRGFQITTVSEVSGISKYRLKTIEKGFALVGIKKDEVKALAKFYNIDEEIIMIHATGKGFQ